MTKWGSSHKEIIEAFDPEDRAKGLQNLDLQTEQLPTDRALGLTWNPETDKLQISAKIKDAVFTKRGVLSYICTLYDPIGMISPFILTAKHLFQRLCKRKAEWDETLNTEEAMDFQRWLQQLDQAKKIEINRPLPARRVAELHHFCDASEFAYAAVSYLRIMNDEGVHVSFLFAKSRLAPIKKMTIPRLELTSAVLATKHDEMLRKELHVELQRSTFWTDSQITLHCLKNKDKRFDVFVSNRLSAIQNSTDVSQWHWVPTKENPADDATRGLKPHELDKRWINGPEFLRSSAIKYPACPAEAPLEEIEAPKAMKATEETSKTDELLNRYSSFYRLKRALVLLRRFIQHRRGLRSTYPLTVEELKSAEISIIRYVQQKAYPSEFDNLRKGKQAGRNSTLMKLEPWVDNDGLMRVSARSERHKQQILLPPKHFVSKLIVKDYHDKTGHAGCEYVLCNIRERFWIPSGRHTIKGIQRNCKICTRYFNNPKPQRMADLIDERTATNQPPFTNVGIDCFGPFLTKRGRSQEKRYGCIYTCLSTRAVHIEMLNSLEADSFINGLMRFSARRGQPESIRCDNGTNFKGAFNELNLKLKPWNKQVGERLVRKGIKWTFNTPSASHQGGAWERLIRAIRRVLTVIVGKTVLDDERLCTVFCEVEGILNNRPITRNPDDNKDDEPLTPNHLLMMRKGTLDIPGTYDKRDEFTRRWRHSQYLADQFWKRWIKEYLPIIQHRQKWLKDERQFRVNDVILLCDETTPRNDWPLGRIMDVHDSRDGKIRTVTVKTTNGTYNRPVNKLCLLEGSDIVN